MESIAKRQHQTPVVRVETSNYAPQRIPLKLKGMDVWRKPHARNHITEFGAAEMGQDCRDDGLSRPGRKQQSDMIRVLSIKWRRVLREL